MRKIALVTPMLQPYRLTFYEKLSKISPDTEWIFYHGVKDIEDGRPAYNGQTAFRNVGLTENIYKIGPFHLVVHSGLVNSVKEFNPDMIIIQSITGNLSYRNLVNWAKRNKKLVLYWACAWEPGRASGLLLKLKNLFVGSFYRKGDAVMTYSTKAITYVKNRGVEESRISVCYNGIEIDDLVKNEKEILEKSNKIKQELSLGNSLVFLYVGGLLPDKKVDLLIDAFSEIRKPERSLKLIIIGDGPLKQNIMYKIKKLNDDRILYLGRILDGVDSYFAASSCLVLPGVGGLALNQAMFWRKICLASEADGTEEDLVINGETGFRFTKGSLESLKDAMIKVTNLPEQRLSEMGNKAREIIENKSNVNHMVDVFTRNITGFFPEIRLN